MIEATCTSGSTLVTNTASRFLRVHVHHSVYHSKLYSRIKTRNSYAVCYQIAGEVQKYGLVLYNLSLRENTVTVINRLLSTGEYCFPHQLKVLKERIVPVEMDENLCAVFVSSFLFKCVYISSCEVHVTCTVRTLYVVFYDD